MKLSDVVNRINGNVDRFTTDLEYYVGGEHFDSNELAVTRKGMLKENLNVLGFKFHFAFQKRDVLFMARNPHLRKAGMVMFDGLCSDATYILRSKDENVLLQEYLALQLQSDHFWNYCESHKVGSVNFANNWTSIANYEFDLPSIEEQKVLADKLWAAYRVKEAYRQLLSTTDDMLKAKFQEMFGDPFDCNVRSKVQLGSICTLNPRKTQKYDENTKVSFFPMDVVPEDGRSIELPSRLYKEVSKGFTFAEEGDVIFAKITPCMENGKGTILRNLSSKIGFGSTEFHVLRPIENVTTAEYLYVLISLPLFRKEAEKNMTGSGGQRRVPISFISDFFVAKPDFQKQKEFVSIYAQTETTKASLRASIEAIDRVIRSLINQ